jgi:hypothetical protein
VTSNSPRLRAAIRAFQEARQELLAALSAEAPGKVVIARNVAVGVVPGTNGQPVLFASRYIRLKRPKPASSPAE